MTKRVHDTTSNKMRSIGHYLAAKYERSILIFPWRCGVAVVGSIDLALSTDYHPPLLLSPAHSFP